MIERIITMLNACLSGVLSDYQSLLKENGQLSPDSLPSASFVKALSGFVKDQQTIEDWLEFMDSKDTDPQFGLKLGMWMSQAINAGTDTIEESILDGVLTIMSRHDDPIKEEAAGHYREALEAKHPDLAAVHAEEGFTL